MAGSIDWGVIAARYISDDSVTLQSLSDQYNIPISTLKSRCSEGGWTSKRRQKTTAIVQKATAKAEKSMVEIAAKFNQDDIKLAQSLKYKVATLLQAEDDLSPQELNSLANTLSTSQKIGRLALGMSTDNSVVTGKDGTPLQPPVFNIIGVVPKNES